MEVIMIIVIVSVFMAAIGIPLLSSLRESDLPEISTIAYFLGLEKLEELAPQTTGSISAEAKAAVVTVYHSRIPNGVSLVSLRTAY
jgi:hypothetical protein